MKASVSDLGKLLLEWYKINHRKLPWRLNRDPYKIWLSETMLQQTTVAAVIGYFEKFVSRFPNVHSLAQASIEEIYELWSGLGYYSRARNLHAAAKIIAKEGFPRSHRELIVLPGFGPYTSRAVSSIAFDEAVGVLDGNVIRVLSRLYGLETEWWSKKERTALQVLADEFAQIGEPYQINQALMELGATVCTPRKTLCLLCPWKAKCLALKINKVADIPLKKPRRKSEYWIWRPFVALHQKKVLVCKNQYAPFLRGKLIFPGKIKKSATKPKTFDLKHSITHHSIYIQIDDGLGQKLKSKVLKAEFGDIYWISIDQLKKLNPSSLLSKILEK